MLKKSSKTDSAEVVFSMPPMEGCEALFLCGEFNDWDVTTHPMQKDADGGWMLAIELEANHDYEFRYCADTGLWYNDPAADAYVPNPYGSDNGVVSTKAN